MRQSGDKIGWDLGGPLPVAGGNTHKTGVVTIEGRIPNVERGSVEFRSGGLKQSPDLLVCELLMLQPRQRRQLLGPSFDGTGWHIGFLVPSQDSCGRI